MTKFDKDSEVPENVIERNFLTKVAVSTVKMVEKRFSTHNKDYETVVFAVKDGYIENFIPLAQDSYDTEEEAKLGHANMMETWVMKDKD